MFLHALRPRKAARLRPDPSTFGNGTRVSKCKPRCLCCSLPAGSAKRELSHQSVGSKLSSMGWTASLSSKRGWIPPPNVAIYGWFPLKRCHFWRFSKVGTGSETLSTARPLRGMWEPHLGTHARCRLSAFGAPSGPKLG